MLTLSTAAKQSLSDVLLWITAIAGGIAVVTGYLSSFLSSQASDEKEVISNRRIAEADARGKDALARVAEADEGLAKAHAAIAEQQARAAQFEKEAEEAKLNAERLRQSIAWRELPKAMQEKIVADASKAPRTLNLRYTDGDPEALALAVQFANTFQKAGWRVGMGAEKLPNMLAMGLIVDAQHPDKAAITSILNESHIPFAESQLPRGLGFNVTILDGPTLFIGSKPR